MKVNVIIMKSTKVNKKQTYTLHPLLQGIKDGGCPDFDEIYIALKSSISLLDALKDTPQDPEWHAEGDVHIHSRMTLEALYKEIQSYEQSAPCLSPEERMILIISTAFHDIAKALTTQEAEIDGKLRIVSPHHAPRGRSYLSSLLIPLGLNPQHIESIFSLIGFHHHPRKILKRSTEKYGAYWSLDRQVPSKLLNLLCLADLKGRICLDVENLVEDHLYFQAFQDDALKAFGPHRLDWQEELEVSLHDLDPLTSRFVRAQAQREAEQGKIHHPQEAISRSYTYRERYAKLYVVSGPSGIGKSSFIQEHYPQATLISLDEIRQELTGTIEDQSQNRKVVQVAFERLRRLLPTSQQIVWDATTLRKDYRNQIFGLADQYKAFTHLDVLTAPIQVALTRNQSRERQVPTSVIQTQYQRWQYPQRDEAHEVVYWMHQADQSWQKASD